jgi:hypothetical protein
MMTLEVIRDLVPRNQKSTITEELIDRLNDINSDPLLMDSFKENFVSYIGVLKSGKYSVEEYKAATQYVSHKLLGDSDIDAYAKTFPDRYQKLIDAGKNRDEMSPYVSAYKKNKLVNQILEQTMIPHHILNAPIYQQAINVQVQLMNYSSSDVVRQKAADSLMIHLKAPETTKIELDIGFKSESIIDDYEIAMREMVAKQKELIAAGGDLHQITNARIRKTEFIEAEIDGQS